MEDILLKWNDTMDRITIGFINSDGDYDCTTYIAEDGGVIENPEDSIENTLIDEFKLQNYEVFTLTEKGLI